MYKFFFVGNDTLSLSYNRIPVKSDTHTASLKKVCCERLHRTEIHDYYEQCKFLFLQQHEFYQMIISSQKAAKTCLDFIKECKSRGYANFLSVVEYDVMMPDIVYGNHYIIACMEDIEVDAIMDKLTKKLPLYTIREQPVVVLKNYTEESETRLDRLFPDTINNLFHEPIMLGKLVKKTSDHDKNFAKHIEDLRTASTAKDLLRSIRRRLNLPVEYQTAIDGHAFRAVSDAFIMIFHCLDTFHTTKPLSEIKNIMLNANNQLIIFVSNYYYYLQSVHDGGAEITYHNKIYGVLHLFHSWIKRQGYQTIDDVFCVVYKGEHYTPPVIYVTDTNFTPLLSLFKAKGFTTLKFKKMNQLEKNDDWLIEVGKNNLRQEVNFCMFPIADPQPKDYGNTIIYSAPCVNQHAGNYHWICMNCEELFKVTAQLKLVCACGTVPSPSTAPECFKCVSNNRRLKLPSGKVDVTSYDQDTLVCNKTEDEINAAASCVILTRTSEPVSASFSIRNLTVTQLLIKKHESVQTETVIKSVDTVHLNIRKPRTYKVIVVRSSTVAKSMILKNIFRMQQNNTIVNDVDKSCDCDSNDCVVDYGTHAIRYIYKNELGVEEFDVHGIMIVIENNTLELSNSADNQIRDTFSRLPRCAIKNCCIVNVFKPTETFALIDAQQQMREFVATFRDQHALPNVPSFVCVDTVVIINHATDNSNVCHESFESSKRGIKQFLETIQTVQPVTPTDLKAADNWKSLCVAFRPHVGNRDPETLRLMATIAENCLTGVAIYCRKSLPLRDNEWPGAVNHWSFKDEKVAATLRDLQQ